MVVAGTACAAGPSGVAGGWVGVRVAAALGAGAGAGGAGDALAAGVAVDGTRMLAALLRAFRDLLEAA